MSPRCKDSMVNLLDGWTIGMLCTALEVFESYDAAEAKVKAQASQERDGR